MTDWIYLGSDERFGSIYISPSGSLLKFIIYDPSSKKRLVFTLRDGIGFIYFLRLENYLKAKKSTLPHLWRYYLDLTRRAKRHVGLNDVLKVLGISYDSLQVLYSKILPIVKARCGNIRLRFRRLFTDRFLKPLGKVRNIHKYFQVVIIESKRRDDTLSIFRKCFTIFQKLKDMGLIRAMRIPKGRPVKYGEECRFTIPCLMDAKTFVTKYPRTFVKYFEDELKAQLKDYPDHEFTIRYFASKLKYALRKGRYIFLGDEDVDFEKLIEKVSRGEPVQDVSTNALVEFSEFKSEDEHYLTIIFNTPIKEIGLYSQVAFFYNKGRLWMHVYEPINYVAYRVTEYKVRHDGKLKFIRTYLYKPMDYGQMFEYK